MTPHEPESNSTEPDAKPAAQYIRMSTEHQQYSTENQADMIREYAQKRGFSIVKTYADEGKSGLRIEGRGALRQMIDDAKSGDAGYQAILVYDISRWGRFQDSDESAYYEYICKRAGVQVYSRFGTLIQAYRLAGYTPNRDFSYVEINRRLRVLHPTLIDDTVQRLESVGASIGMDNGDSHLVVNGEYTAALVLSRCLQTPAGSLRWSIRFGNKRLPDITIMVRMNPANDEPSDFYLLPLFDIRTPSLCLAEYNAAYVDAYRFDSLDGFAQLALRTRIEARS